MNKLLFNIIITFLLFTFIYSQRYPQETLPHEDDLAARVGVVPTRTETQVKMANGFQGYKSMHHKLISEVLDPQIYDPSIRPIKDFFTPTNVTVRLNLYQILSVDERSQNILLYVWMTQMWSDEFVGWNPVEYGNIETVTVPYDKVWLPDTYLYNNLEMQREVTERWISVMLTTNTSTNPPKAQATFRYPAIYKISCKMYVLYFPFDIQNCTLTFGSWTSDIMGLDFQPESDKVPLEGYVENEEWKVIEFTSYREVNTFNCCPHPFVLVKMNLVIQRKPLYYIVNLIIPTFIITIIATIGFFTPSTTSGERVEKVNLGITTLLAMSILLLMISDQMPTTSNFIPLMGWFFLSIILLISLGTALTSALIFLQMKGRQGKRIHPLVKQWICIKLAAFLGVVKTGNKSSPETSIPETFNKTYEPYYKPAPLARSEDHSPDHTTSPLLGVGGGRTSPMTIVNPFSFFEKKESDMQRRANSAKAFDFRGDTTCLRLLQQIRHKMFAIHDEMHAKDFEDLLLGEWEHLVNVLDRVFLIVFILATVTITLFVCLLGTLSSQGYA